MVRNSVRQAICQALQSGLPEGEIRQIVDLQIDRLAQLVEEQGLSLEVTAAARDAIAEQGYDPAYGARPLRRVIQQRIQNPLATELLRGNFQERDGVRVDYEDGTYSFT